MSIICLDQILKKRKYRVIELDSSNNSVVRLMSMGLLQDKVVRLVHKAPLGDPIVVEFDSCQISLRCTDASCIKVEEFQ